MRSLWRSLTSGWALRRGSRSNHTDFQLLAENSRDVILLCDLDCTAQYVSPSIYGLLGVTREEMIGHSHLSFVLPEDMPTIDAIRTRRAAGDQNGVAAFRMLRKDGTAVWVEGSGKTFKNPATGKLEFLIVIRDISERKALESKLSALAMTDGLTGLGNRRAFDQALENEWRLAKRAGTELSLLLLDLDRFKAFNDQYGHQVGDDCLRAVANTIQNAVKRTGDLAARYGGEELAVILPNTNSIGAVHVGCLIRAAVEALSITHGENREGNGLVTVSIGVATALSRVGGSVHMPAGLLQAADMALYKAKQRGRNRVESTMLLTSEGVSAAANAA